MAYLRLLLALPVLALTLVTGCGEAEEPYGLDATELEERFACDDLTVVAASSDGQRALMIGIDDGLAAAALAAGSPVEATYALPDERLTVRWVEGINVYQGHCGRDTGAAWELAERNDAIAGEVFVRVTPGADDSLTLTAELYDVRLMDDDDLESEDEMSELVIGQTSLEDISIDS